MIKYSAKHCHKVLVWGYSITLLIPGSVYPRKTLPVRKLSKLNVFGEVPSRVLEYSWHCKRNLWHRARTLSYFSGFAGGRNMSCLGKGLAVSSALTCDRLVVSCCIHDQRDHGCLSPARSGSVYAQAAFLVNFLDLRHSWYWQSNLSWTDWGECNFGKTTFND